MFVLKLVKILKCLSTYDQLLLNLFQFSFHFLGIKKITCNCHYIKHLQHNLFNKSETLQ